MSKKNQKRVPAPDIQQSLKQKTPAAEPARPIRHDWNSGPLVMRFRFQAIVVALLGILLYVNTWKHEFALDDTIVIVKNEYVAEGFRGIKDIMTKDAFDSYYRQSNSSNQLSGGRYRPLSIITFAIEQQLLGTDSVDARANLSYQMTSYRERKLLSDMHVRHAVNTLLYALSLVIFLYFLRYIVLRDKPIAAFAAVILFAIHPLHTEVVANVKSRDEIMSFMFICLTFITAFHYRENNKTATLITSLLCYLAAFLSKEYAISMVLLLPMAFILFHNDTLAKSLRACLPYLAVIGVYGLLRLQVIAPANPDSDADILNNPYAFASAGEKLATQIATSLNYLKLLIYPHPLSSDYSYATIPYKTFGHPAVLLSLLVHLAIVAGIVYFYKRDKVLCFGLAFYLFHLLLVNNLLFNIGATMGERLAYHSSAGFAIIVAYLLYKGGEKMGAAQATAIPLGIAGALTIVFGYLTVDRNKAWHDDTELFRTDIKTVPNSALVNANVGFSYLHVAESATDTAEKKKYARLSLPYYNKSLEVHKTFVSSYMNRGLAYFFLDNPDSARYNIEKVIEYYPKYVNISELYYNIGVNFYMHHRVAEAIGVWKKVLINNPDYKQAQQSINIASAELAQQGITVK